MRRLLIPFVVSALVSLAAGRICSVSSGCQCILDRPWKMNIVCQSHKHFINYSHFSESNITSLQITNASAYSLHQSMFINLKLKKLTLSNFRLINVQPEWHEAFVGVKGTLERLEIYNSDFQFPWNFDPYELIAHLTHLTIVRSVVALNPWKITLNQLKHLQYIEFRGFGMFHVELNVEDLSDLRVVSLSGNGIRYIKRGMFPRSANKLWHIDLSHNLIQNLPEDIFQHMPKLREVRLDHNKLKVLREGIFSDMINIGQLKELWIQDNLLTCDQNICWLEKLGLPSFTLSASCHDPKLREALNCH